MTTRAQHQTRTIFDEWFDDLPVRETHRTPRCSISAEEVRKFADLTGDHHPMHLDPEYGARSLFGRNVVHGMLVLSRGMGVVPLNSARTLVLRRCEAVFKRPVLVDQNWFADVWITRKREIDENLGLATMAVVTKVLPVEGCADDSAAKIAVRGVVDGIWARTPAAFGALDLETPPERMS